MILKARKKLIFLCIGAILVAGIKIINPYRISIDLFQKKVVRNNQDVKSVNVLFDNGVWEKHLRILITFHDDTWLLLGNVTDNQSVIRIEGCDGYHFFLCYRSSIKPDDQFHTPLLYAYAFGEIIGRPLNDLNDIIINHIAISKYINGLPDISDKFESMDNYIDWVWKSNQYKIENINNYEIIIFKMPLNEIMIRDWYP